MTPEQIQAQKEKFGRLIARHIRQLATHLRDVAKDVGNPIHVNRVIGTEFANARTELTNAIFKLANIVVPKNAKGYVNASALMKDIISHAFSPKAATTPKPKKRSTGK